MHKIIKTTAILFLIIFFSLAGLRLQAEETSPGLAASIKVEESQGASSTPIEEKKISLSLRNIDVIEALKFFSMKTGLNIIPTQKVSGRVTLTVELASTKDVFDIMLRSNNLAYDKRGDIYNVMTEDEYRRLYGKNFFDSRKVKVFRLKYAIPEQAFNMIDTIKSSIGRILVDPESGTVMVMDTPANIDEIEKALSALEQETVVKVFDLKYAKAKDVEEQLKSQLDAKKAGSIRSDERTNQVIVQTLPERMKNIEVLIAKLDKKTKAVLIDTKIVQIKLSDQYDRGIEWEGLFRLAGKLGMTYIGSYPYSAVQSSTAAWRSRSQVVSDMANGIGSYPSGGFTTNYVGTSQVKPGEAMHVGIVDDARDFDVLIRYLQTMGKTKILSNPTISVVNNQEAKIHVGERRAFVTTTTTTGASTTTVSEDVTYVDVGVRLSIVPMINDDGYVTMKIRPEISSVVGQVPTSSNNVIPIIDTSMAETTVIAKDGSTIMIGGLGKEEKTENTYQVPILGKIPVLGALFQTKTKKTEQTELLIILTPYIFEGDRLVTPKDKEMELFGIKPVKKFDVFREEVWQPGPSTTPNLPRDIFAPKMFQPYSISSLDETAPAQEAIVEPEEKLAYKGTKGYEITAEESLAEVAKNNVLMDTKQDLYTPEPRGYRGYN